MAVVNISLITDYDAGVIEGTQPVDAREVAVEQFQRGDLLAADAQGQLLGGQEGEFVDRLAHGDSLSAPVETVLP